MKSLRTSKQLVTRREALAAGGAVALSLSLPNLVPAQQDRNAGPDVRGTLSRMTLADKVGQILMACLDAKTLEEKIDRYRCGSLLVLAWSTSKDPKVVRDFGIALTRGASRARCGTMAQHFPAHGATPRDSHSAYPVVELDRQTLMRDHLEVSPAQADELLHSEQDNRLLADIVGGKG